MNQITSRPFRPGDEAAFRALNEDWIVEHFSIEEKDKEVLGDPAGQIIQPGGAILMMLENDRAIGCCALLAMPGGGFEVGKMAIARKHRGRGLGRQLLASVVEYARELGAKRLYLEASMKLPNAIHLYEAQGFTHLPPERVKRSPYARSNVYMEMFLE